MPALPMIDFTEKDGTLIFEVCVIPRSSKSEIVGEYDNAVKVKLSSAPVEGAANKELIKLFSKKFDVAKGDVEIIRGETSKRKKIKISGGRSEILRRLC